MARSRSRSRQTGTKLRQFWRRHEIAFQILFIAGGLMLAIGLTFVLFKFFYRAKEERLVEVVEQAARNDKPDEWGDADRSLGLPTILERSIKVQSLRAANGDPLNSFTYRGQITLYEKTGNRTGRAIVFFKMPDKLRVSLSGPRMRYSMGFNGRDGWASTEEDGVIRSIQLSDDELQRARHSTLLSTPAGHFLAQQDWCALMPDASVGDKPVYVVRYDHGSGITQDFFIDRRTFMVLRRVLRDGSIEVAADYDDFRRVGDAWAAHIIRTSENGILLNQYVIQEYTINAGLLPGTFELPEN